MKDTEANILKAFLAALLQQSEPLPPEIQTQLNQLAVNLEAAIAKLEALAEQYPPLTNPFNAAISYLEAHAAQRGRGFSSNQEYEQSDPLITEIENIAYPIRRSVTPNERQPESKTALELLTFTQKILSASDSWQAMRDTIIAPPQY